MTSPCFNMWKFLLSSAKGSNWTENERNEEAMLLHSSGAVEQSLKVDLYAARPGSNSVFCVISVVTLLINMCFWCFCLKDPWRLLLPFISQFYLNSPPALITPPRQTGQPLCPRANPKLSPFTLSHLFLAPEGRMKSFAPRGPHSPSASDQPWCSLCDLPWQGCHSVVWRTSSHGNCE